MFLCYKTQHYKEFQDAFKVPLHLKMCFFALVFELRIDKTLTPKVYFHIHLQRRESFSVQTVTNHVAF